MTSGEGCANRIKYVSKGHQFTHKGQLSCRVKSYSSSPYRFKRPYMTQEGTSPDDALKVLFVDPEAEQERRKV